MNRPKLSKEILVPLSLIVTIAWQVSKPLVNLIWNASAAFYEMRTLPPKINRLEAKVDEVVKTQNAHALEQVAIKKDIEAMRHPLENTQANVKNVVKSLKKMNPGPVVTSPFQPGPFGSIN